MSRELQFPIPLFDFLTSVSVATGKTGGYVSGSASRRGEGPATSRVAVEHYRRRILDPGRQRMEVRFIAEALRAWSWAFHLTRPRDILRGLASSGEVAESDVGHAASMLHECDKRYPDPYHDFRFFGQLPLSIGDEGIARSLLIPDGKTNLLKRIRVGISGALSSIMSRSEFGCFSLAIIDVGGVSTKPRPTDIARLTSFFEFLIHNGRELNPLSIRAAGRLSPTSLAIITGDIDKALSKEFCDKLIGGLSDSDRPADATGLPLPISVGVTDFFDYPEYRHIIEGTRKLPRRPPDFTPISPDLRSPEPYPFIIQAHSALNQARLFDGDSVAVYQPPADKYQIHKRTPEMS